MRIVAAGDAVQKIPCYEEKTAKKNGKVGSPSVVPALRRKIFAVQTCSRFSRRRMRVRLCEYC